MTLTLCSEDLHGFPGVLVSVLFTVMGQGALHSRKMSTILDFSSAMLPEHLYVSLSNSHLHPMVQSSGSETNALFAVCSTPLHLCSEWHHLVVKVSQHEHGRLASTAMTRQRQRFQGRNMKPNVPLAMHSFTELSAAIWEMLNSYSIS